MTTTTSEKNPRDRILETARELFYEQGYQATGINQIIKEAEVAKASFYHHFPSKDDLAVAYVEAYHADLMRRLRANALSTDDPQARLTRFFEARAARAIENNFQGCGMMNISIEFPAYDHKVRQAVLVHKREVRAFLHQLVADILAAADVSAAEIEQRAHQIYVLYEGAVIESRIFNDTWPITAAKEAALRLLHS